MTTPRSARSWPGRWRPCAGWWPTSSGSRPTWSTRRARRRTPPHSTWRSPRRVGRRAPGPESAERLGLGALDPERRIGTLSGGQRTRLALATVMTTRPSCLLLDEPTNHLDDQAVDQLTAFLRDLPGVVVLASHDRVLLDDVCSDLFDLDPRRRGLGTDGNGGRRSAVVGRRTRSTARRHDAAGRRRTPPSRRSWTGCGQRRRSVPRRSPTTGGPATTTSSSTASRGRTSTARWRAGRRTPSGASRPPSVSRCASRGRR